MVLPDSTPPPQHCEIQPPGTFYILRERDENGIARLVLDPTPSVDPNDPLNWSYPRKAINFTLVLIVTVVIFTALSIQTLFWQYLIFDLDASFDELNTSSSINAAGCTIGCLIFIPFAIKYGRRPVYIISTAVMLGMSIWSAKMETVWELYTTNMLMGLAGATNEAIVGMTVADMFFVHHRGTMNGLYIIAVMAGSFLAPILAGLQATNQHWRASYNVLSVFTGITLVLFIFFFEETKYVPLFSRHDVQPQAANNPKTSQESSTKRNPDTQVTLVTEECIPANEEFDTRIDYNIPIKTWLQRRPFHSTTNESLLKLAYSPLLVLFQYPAVTFVAFQYGFGLCWLLIVTFIQAEVYPYPPYNFTAAGVGFLGIGTFVGALFGSLYSGYIADKAIIWFAKRNNGFYEPEMRLYLLHLPAFALCGGLIMFGVCTAQGMHWIYPSIGAALFGFGMAGSSDAILTYVIDSYRNITGEAFVAIAVVRNVVSIGSAQVVGPWMNTMGLQNMFILMGFLALIIALLYLPMIYFGKRARVWTTPRYTGHA